MSLELNPVFEGSGLQLGPVFNVAGVPTLGTVTPGDTSVTFTWSGPATHYRLTPLDTGVPGSAVSIPPSPATVTGLDANREYRVEIGPNATTWTDFEDFGTNNPGTGGGEFTLPSEFLAGATLSGVVAGGSLGSGGAFAAGALLGSVRAGGALSGAAPVAAFGTGAALNGVIGGGALQGAVVSAFGAGAVLDGLLAGGSLSGRFVAGARTTSRNVASGRRPANLARS